MTFNTGFSKSIFTSVTFWGAVVSVFAQAVPTIAAKLGVTSGNSLAIAGDITTAIGFIITVYGRFTANQTVTLTGGPSTPSSGTKG
jgi:hypothetical protein